MMSGKLLMRRNLGLPPNRLVGCNLADFLGKSQAPASGSKFPATIFVPHLHPIEQVPF